MTEEQAASSAVDNPIINNAYEEPTRWLLPRSAAHPVPPRCQSHVWLRVPHKMRGLATFFHVAIRTPGPTLRLVTAYVVAPLLLRSEFRA